MKGALKEAVALVAPLSATVGPNVCCHENVVAPVAVAIRLTTEPLDTVWFGEATGDVGAVALADTIGTTGTGHAARVTLSTNGAGVIWPGQGKIGPAMPCGKAVALGPAPKYGPEPCARNCIDWKFPGILMLPMPKFSGRMNSKFGAWY